MSAGIANLPWAELVRTGENRKFFRIVDGKIEIAIARPGEKLPVGVR